MNPRDLENFEYIMSLSDSEFDQWLLTITNDDVNYAIELIQIRREQLDLELGDILDDVDDCTQAMEIINRIKSKI